MQLIGPNDVTSVELVMEAVLRTANVLFAVEMMNLKWICCSSQCCSSLVFQIICGLSSCCKISTVFVGDKCNFT